MEDEAKSKVALPTRDDLDLVDWRAVLNGASKATCTAYHSACDVAAKKATNPADGRVLRLIAEITSMVLQRGARAEPLSCMFEMGGRRSVVPADLSDDELDLLAHLLTGSLEPELDARICDILWTRRRRPEHAQQAIESYLASAQKLEGEWLECLIRVERALSFSWLLKDVVRRSSVLAYVETWVAAERVTHRLGIAGLELLVRAEHGSVEKWAMKATLSAQAAESVNGRERARMLWTIAADGYRTTKNAHDERRARLAIAETFAADAEASSDAGTALLYKVEMFRRAIAAFRQVGNSTQRISELHHKLVAIQERVHETMGHFEAPKIDLTEAALEAMRKVDGCSFHEALFRLAVMLGPRSRAQAEQQAIESAKAYPLSALWGRTKVDGRGRVVASVPSGSFDNSPESQAALAASMCEQASWARGGYVVGLIEPVRRKIWLEHGVCETDFVPLVSNNPFVPAGRERLFARGLYAGLTGDFVQAAHLLVPQLEHATRALLNEHGVITTGLGTDGLQEENSFQTLLAKAELAAALGEDVVFDLRSLLIEKAGPNLRNRLAHGLMAHDEFHSVDVAYVWWLALHLCFRPFIGAVADATEAEPVPDGQREIPAI